MNNSKKTRKALLSSLVALMLCFSMLIGTTMAWFTDTASTGVNTIKAGTLDIDLLMNDGEGKYESIVGVDGSIFKLGETTNVAQNSNDTLWEPGKTQVVYLAIKNKGNLAAKYSVDILATMPADATADMTNVMEYVITPDVQSGVGAWDSENAESLSLGTTRATADVAIGAGATHYFALSVHMDEDAGNEYQGQTIQFNLAVTATQNNVEADSFNPNYDKDATYEATLAAGTATAAVNVTKDAEGNVTSVKVTEETTVVATNASNEEVATLTVPADTKLENEAGNISITVTPKDEVHEGVSVASTQGAKTYDVEVTGLAAEQEVEVEMFVGKNLTGVKLYHNDVEVTPITYNASTGIVTFTTTSFSPYTVVYNASADLPYAVVKELGPQKVSATWGIGGTVNEFDLNAAYQFNTAEDYEAGKASKYAKWHADFVVSANKNIAPEAVVLAGYYNEWCQYNNNNWVAMVSSETIAAGTEIRLVETLGATVNYEELCQYGYGNDGFQCGLADLADDASNDGTTITVELRLFEVEEPSAENGNSWNVETGKYVTIGTYSYTF